MQIWQAVMACNLRSTNSDSIVWTISTVQQQLFSLSFFFREHTELAGQTIGAFLEKVCSLVTTPPGDYTIFLLIVPPIPIVIIYMKKLRASDWLKTSAFSYNSSAML